MKYKIRMPIEIREATNVMERTFTSAESFKQAVRTIEERLKLKCKKFAIHSMELDAVKEYEGEFAEIVAKLNVWEPYGYSVFSVVRARIPRNQKHVFTDKRSLMEWLEDIMRAKAIASIEYSLTFELAIKIEEGL
jgi:hypothetical protein